MATIYLTRHGQASFGQHDYDCLSPLGERQAVITGEWLAQTLGKSFQLSGSGTLLRQQQTLAGIHKGMSKSGYRSLCADITFPGLDELDSADLMLAANPDFTDRAQMDLAFARATNPKQAFFDAYRAALFRWMSGDYDNEYQESWHTFKSRTIEVLYQSTRQMAQNDSAVLVSSGGVISVIILQLLNCPDTEMFRINRQIHNTSITAISERNGKLSLHGFNNYSHLEVKGEKALLTRI
ncbi:histidine phosphatase family protein [Endozoicomonas sp. GU-1]|uniref:histidine phosphatase family protein n=2 Tax=Endozoicomonas sp. GU-1 TaxID=3009078 RepID=UPI0022B5609B|nr:histidine phosphatase family protein [Endozoicomonas sp. GU-1]WBA82342.1 histidine phosphatase family protein [Endozoicomonas sp. GU-1]